jgi:hypothetical protein
MDFDKIAYNLLNKVVLNSGGNLYRICEIEMYCYSELHPDLYVHRVEDQKTNGKFYFHKFSNGTYKAGTFKGLDITYGDEKTYFGVLIRSILNLKTRELTEGSCNCVNELIGGITVKEFMSKFDGIISINNKDFGLIDYKLPIKPLYHGPRIGLSDKYPEFRDRDYRYAIYIEHIVKKRKTFKLLN